MVDNLKDTKKYIKKKLKEGITKKEIEKKLIEEGIEKEIIDSLFKTIEKRKVGKSNKTNFGSFFKKFSKKNNQIRDVPLKETKQTVPLGTQPKIDPDPVYVENEFKPQKGINSKIKEITERLDNITQPFDDKKNKEFKIPYGIKNQLKDLAKKNKVMVILLKTNRSCEPFVTDIRNGFIMINGVPHNASTDFIFLWKGKYPTLVVPEWDINPIGTQDYYAAVEGHRTADPIATVIRMIENKEILMKNPMNMKMLIWVGLGVAIVGYALFGGG